MDKKTRSIYKEPKFYLDKRPGKPAAIFLKYSFEPGKRLSYFTGETIEPDKWSNQMMRVKRNVNGAAGINDALDKLFEAAKSIVRDHRLQNKSLTIQEFKTMLDISRGKATQKTDFFSVYSQFIETESRLKGWTIGTIRKFETIKKQLFEFEKANGTIHLSQIDEIFFQKLIEFWQDEHKLRNTTTKIYVRYLKWFLKWSYEKGIVTDTYKRIKVNLKENRKKIIYLDLNEIRAIYHAEIPNYLEQIRDVFIFQCLTGLRYSDLRNLKASDYNNGSISVATIKTGEIVEIELNDTTAAIWNKYSEFQEATGRALPVLQNAKYNYFLKEMAKNAKIIEPVTITYYKGSERFEEVVPKYSLITSHSGRKSFVTNGLFLGISAETLRSWTGHRSEKVFQSYYEVVKQKKVDDIKKFKL